MRRPIELFWNQATIAAGRQPFNRNAKEINVRHRGHSRNVLRSSYPSSATAAPSAAAGS